MITNSVTFGCSFDATVLESYCKQLDRWGSDSPAPDLRGVLESIHSLHANLSGTAERLLSRAGESTYGNALLKVRELIQVKDDLHRIERTKAQLHLLDEELNRQTLLIDKGIKDHTQGLISQLEEDVDQIY